MKRQMKIVLVCIGLYQEYIQTCVAQLKVWGNNDIVVLTDSIELKEILKKKLPLSVEIIQILSEQCFGLAERFEECSLLDLQFRKGFFRHCFKRFVYLYGYLKTFQETNILHFENDIMVYRNMNTIQKYFTNEIHLVMDSENRCIPSIMYFKDYICLEKCLENHVHWHENDMTFWAQCQRKFSNEIQTLPIIHDDKYHPFSKYYVDDLGIFDAAAIGQYLGGINPENNNNDSSASTVGFVNETCIVKYNDFSFSWLQTETNLWRPILKSNTGHHVYINNLHIHSKNLESFSSRIDVLKNLEHTLCHFDLHFQLKMYAISDHCITWKKDNHEDGIDWKFMQRPIWNKKLLYISPSEFEHFVKNHHIFIRRPFIIISPVVLENIFDNDDDNCKGLFVKNISHSSFDQIYLLPHINEFPTTLVDLIINTNFHREKSKTLHVLKNTSNHLMILHDLLSYKYCFFDTDHQDDAYFNLIWYCLALQVIPVLKKSYYSKVLKKTLNPYPIIEIDHFDPSQYFSQPYVYPNYPILDSQFYRNKLRHL